MRKIFIAILGFFMLAIGSASAQELVDIDIKPGSCPNPFNGKSKGSVPVAIVGTGEFDVTDIDITSIKLAGVEALKAGVIDDSTQPIGDVVVDPDPCYNCFDAEENFNCDLDPDIDGDDAYCGDEEDDLIVKFDTQALADAIAELTGGVDRDECVELTLTGATNDGFPIEGYDSVLIRTKIRN